MFPPLQVEVSLALLAGLVQAAFAAAVYSLLAYAKRRQAGEEFDPKKFAATVIVGAAVGGIIFLTPGAELTEEAVTTRLATYAGTVVVVENLLKIVMGRLDMAPETLQPRQNP